MRSRNLRRETLRALRECRPALVRYRSLSQGEPYSGARLSSKAARQLWQGRGLTSLLLTLPLALLGPITCAAAYTSGRSCGPLLAGDCRKFAIGPHFAPTLPHIGSVRGLGRVEQQSNAAERGAAEIFQKAE